MKQVVVLPQQSTHIKKEDLTEDDYSRLSLALSSLKNDLGISEKCAENL